MPTRYSKQGEIQQMQYEVANEIRRDAAPIAKGVFGNNARHPDMATLSNAELDNMYRQAYLKGDRTFLMQEAQRDPQQFLEVTDRLGVPDPPTDMQGNPIPSAQSANALADKLHQQALQNAAQATPPPTPGAVGAGPPVAAPPAPAALPPPASPQMPLPGMAPPTPPGTL